MAQLNAVAKVKISGATGPNAHLINGVFVLTSGTVANVAPVYQKEGNDHIWLALGTNEKWWVTSTEGRGTNREFCYSDEKGLANPCEASSWKVDNGNDWEIQEGVVAEQAGTVGEELRTLKQFRSTAGERALKQPARVKISSATGPNSHLMKGVFVMISGTVEKGAPVYQKEGTDHIWRARGTTVEWWVTDTEGKGTDSGWCHSVEAGLANPWGASSWNVHKNGACSWELQEGVVAEQAGSVGEELRELNRQLRANLGVPDPGCSSRGAATEASGQ